MNVKTKNILGLAAVVALAAVLSLLAGCQPADSDSIGDIIDKFIDGVNNDDLEKIKECLDSDATSYATSLTMTFWDAHFDDTTPYTVSSFAESGNSATVTFTPTAGTAKTFYFDMTDQGDTYDIRRIRDNSSSGTAWFE